jgi:hypothetical protein
MYNLIKNDIYGVFASTQWKAENILVVPENFTGTLDTLPYIRLTIAPSSSTLSSFGVGKEVSGLMILSIHVSTEKGDSEAYTIAQKLDGYFQAKQLTNKTQFKVSYISTLGVDRDNPKIYRVDYFIPFKNYGE